LRIVMTRFGHFRESSSVQGMYRRRASQFFPAPNCNVDVKRIDFHGPRTTSASLRGHDHAASSLVLEHAGMPQHDVYRTSRERNLEISDVVAIGPKLSADNPGAASGEGIDVLVSVKTDQNAERSLWISSAASRSNRTGAAMGALDAETRSSIPGPGCCRSLRLRPYGFELDGMGHFWLVDFVDCIERCYIQTFPFLFPSFMPVAPFALLPSVTAIA
jgi:hypothetical protein